MISTRPPKTTQAPSAAFRRRRRNYQVTMREDTELSASAKLVLWVISEHWNEQTGEARVGTATIARETGMSQANVRLVLQQERMAMHVQIEVGSKGSGHSNRYRPIEHLSAQSDAPETAQSDAPIEPPPAQYPVPIEQFLPPIEQTSAMNLSNHEERTSPVERGRASSAPPQLDEVLQCYPDASEPLRQTLISALRSGMTPAQIYAATPIAFDEEDIVAAIRLHLPHAPAYNGGGVTMSSSR